MLRRTFWLVTSHWSLVTLLAGCATAQYAIRPTPTPDESPSVVALERQVSNIQANRLEEKTTILDPSAAKAKGYDLDQIVGRLTRVTERPGMFYRVYLLSDSDPNAAALADGRIYVTMGMIDYLAWRKAPEDELAFVIAHELAHTNAQHIVKLYGQLQWTGFLSTAAGMIAIGTLSRGVSSGEVSVSTAQRSLDATQLLTNMIAQIHLSGYNQGQELEADQLGLRYLLRAGFDPEAALRMLEDFQRFEIHGTFLRTHPYVARRAQDLGHFLDDARANPSLLGESDAQRISGSRGRDAWGRFKKPYEALPQLRLEKIEYNHAVPSARVAVINGERLHEGAMISGMQIGLIEPKRVRLDRGLQTYWLDEGAQLR
ncbi:MAG: M48 family metalloprotease [Candidatus Omnitrophica bacterium]|nr:M48 family metalloprotease [Candidatus Omnitrophota bacterium]